MSVILLNSVMGSARLDVTVSGGEVLTPAAQRRAGARAPSGVDSRDRDFRLEHRRQVRLGRENVCGEELLRVLLAALVPG